MRVYKQRLASTCGPRSVQTALAYYGLYPRYKDIKMVCETDSFGTVLAKIDKAANHFGLFTQVYIDDSVTIKTVTDNLSMGCLVMVHWYTGVGEGGKDTTHVATAYDYDETYIYLADTSSHLYTEPYITMRTTMLEKCWKAHPETRWLLAMYL